MWSMPCCVRMTACRKRSAPRYRCAGYGCSPTLASDLDRLIASAANGCIGQYEVYVSTDGTNWGTAVATGAFANDASQKDVRSTAKTGQYSRLRAVSEVAGNPWTSAAEIYALN